ncbi:hypothetical protein JZ751_027002, partial [Albula glossodonta]
MLSEDGVDSDAKIILFGRALKSSIKLDPIDLVGKRYKVSNYLDDTHTPRDFLHLIKPEIDEAMGKTFTYDILFHNCEHQATLYRYGLKKSQQIEKIYAQIYPTWKELFEQKKLRAGLCSARADHSGSPLHLGPVPTLLNVAS